MSSFVGESVSNKGPTVGKLLNKKQYRGKSKFIMMVHPDKWIWNGEKYVPKLGKLVLDPGVQGVKEYRGRVDDSLARIYYSKQGWIIIENGDPRLEDVLEDGIYLHRFKCTNGRFAYTYKWQTPHELLGRTKWDFDKNISVSVTDLLVEKGMIPTMSPRLKQHHLDIALEHLSRAENTYAKDNNSVNKARLATRKTLVAALKKDLEASLE